MIKVYATVGLQNNLITTIPFKGVKVRVEFTGGNSMKNIPAKLFTRDPFVMKALDSSDQLGRLYYVYQTIKEDGDEKAGQKVKTAGKPADTAVLEPAKEPEPVREPEEPAVEAAGDGESSSQKLEFENLAEAVNYIATRYGEQVETETQVRKFIEEKEGRKCIIHKG